MKNCTMKSSPRLFPMLAVLLCLFLTFTSLLTSCQNPDNPFSGTLPVAIRSPYFNSWVNASGPNSNFPVFWTNSLRTWSGLVRIDNVTWSWLGGANYGASINNATLKSTKVTPTQTVFVYQTDKMDLTVTFLSPIEPSDPIRQSLPFTYVAFEAISTDGKPHDVQIYSDVGAGDWVAQSPFSCVYDWGETGNNVFWTSRDTSGLPLAETAGQATDITLYYATQKVPNMVSRFGSERECHVFFSESGPAGLARPANETIPGHVNVFSIAYDVGPIMTTSSPIVWTLGIVRNPVLTYYINRKKSQLRYPYYASQYTKTGDIIDFVLSDFSGALNRAIALDNKVLSPASAISPKYADLVSLSVRQTIGGTELTISKGVDGGWNISDVKAFMKDVGTSRRVNPVEVLYASFPYFLFIDPSYGGKLLTPLLTFQESFPRSVSYPVRDLGDNYPNTTAAYQIHNQGVEQSANMLIMVYAHARVSNDQSLIIPHYHLFRRWAFYLGNRTLTPRDQATADFEPHSNDTNLAIKGIIALQAMVEIGRILGKDDDVAMYSNISSNYLRSWMSLALSSNSSSRHILSSYGDPDTSWVLAYSLFADKLLPTSIIDPNISQLQTDYYRNLLSVDNGQGNLHLDSSSNKTNFAWILHCAATVSDPGVRDMLIERVLNQALTSTQFPSIYDGSGPFPSGRSSPAQGGVFSLLALSLFNRRQTTSSSPPPPLPSPPTNSPGSDENKSKKNKISGPIIGCVIGILVIVGFTTAMVRWALKRRAADRHVSLSEFDGNAEPLGPWHVTPFSTSREGSASLLISVDPTQTGLDVNPSPRPPNTGVIRSRKELEAGFTLANPATSQEHEDSPSSSSADVVDQQRSTDVRAPRSEVSGLRAEVENLREAVRQIQTGRLETVSEAPPGYQSVHADA